MKETPIKCCGSIGIGDGPGPIAGIKGGGVVAEVVDFEGGVSGNEVVVGEDVEVGGVVCLNSELKVGSVQGYYCCVEGEGS